MSKIANVAKQFSDSELRKVCKEFGIQTVKTATSAELSRAIIKDINANGIPVAKDGKTVSKDISDLAVQLLYVAEYVDENGKLLGVEEEQEPAKSKKEVTKEEAKPVEQEEKLPPCYGYADDADPSCQKCKALKLCTKARIERRPECYGLYFSKSAPECQACLEATNCKAAKQVISNRSK